MGDENVGEMGQCNVFVTVKEFLAPVAALRFSVRNLKLGCIGWRWNKDSSLRVCKKHNNKNNENVIILPGYIVLGTLFSLSLSSHHV